MADRETSADLEKSEQKVTSVPDLYSSILEMLAMMKEGKKWSAIKKILDPKGPFGSYWRSVFAVSCIVGVLMDPLFFYIPYANEDNKCIEFHRGLMITMAIRTIADIPYLMHLIFRIRSSLIQSKGFFSRIVEYCLPSRITINYTYIFTAIDIFAVIPIPQMLVFLIYSESYIFSSFLQWNFMTVYFLMQFIPRVVRVYLITTKLSKETGQVWLQVISFSIFQFVLSSHVLGSFWYVSSIQRLMACWKQYSCGNDPKCEIRTLFCDNPAFRNITLLNASCQPTNSPDTTLFDYGIFFDPIASSLVGTKNLSQKLIHCFWWGLRNLSSLGQNLETNTNLYENLLAIVIFFSGMILFVVSLNGNLELVGKLGREKKIEKKMETKDQEIQRWLLKNGLNDKDMKKVIMDYVKDELEENKDVHMETIHFILPALQHETGIALRFACLQKVPALQNISQQTLEAICELLRPVTYPEASYIIREGEPLDMMLFITQGLVRVYTTGEGRRIDSLSDKCLNIGDFYGQELIETSSSDLPITNRIVKSVTRVGAFALMASDLKNALKTLEQ